MTDAREALAALIENLVARVEFNASEHGEDAWWRGHVQGMKDAVFEVERLAAGWTPPCCPP